MISGEYGIWIDILSARYDDLFVSSFLGGEFLVFVLFPLGGKEHLLWDQKNITPQIGFQIDSVREWYMVSILLFGLTRGLDLPLSKLGSFGSLVSLSIRIS